MPIFSGGMVRRMEIARSTLHRPKVLFLDEPTFGLDPIARDAVWKHLIDRRANCGTTLFFTTHYLDLTGQVILAYTSRIDPVGFLPRRLHYGLGPKVGPCHS